MIEIFDEFQSTLPMRGVTSFIPEMSAIRLISIHTPHAGSDETYHVTFHIIIIISIHTPHAGSDCFPPALLYICSLFQSTLPMRGVTDFTHIFILCHKISIHTPHAGSDFLGKIIPNIHSYFNPHSPCGE